MVKLKIAETCNISLNSVFYIKQKNINNSCVHNIIVILYCCVDNIIGAAINDE